MDAETVRKVIGNLRNPMNSKVRIQFTARSILFLTNLFDGKKTDVIEIHCILLRIAHICGCFHDSKDVRYINLRDLVVYLYSQMPLFISREDMENIVSIFSTDIDSDYREVVDMKIIAESITCIPSVESKQS